MYVLESRRSASAFACNHRPRRLVEVVWKSYSAFMPSLETLSFFLGNDIAVGTMEA